MTLRLPRQTPFPPAEPDGALDWIFIEGFSGETIIGIDDDELRLPQSVVIDLAAGLSRAAACCTDRIQDTIDYGVVREQLIELLASHGVKLLEALAEKVAQLLLQRFGAACVRVSIRKPCKFADVGAVGVSIERIRGVCRVAATALHNGSPGMPPVREGLPDLMTSQS